MSTTTAAPSGARWVQLVVGLVAMMAISSPQYVWTLFTKPLQGAMGAGLPAIQVTLTILIVLQTWTSPVQGYLIDKFGPRLLVSLGGLLSGLGWVLASNATSLTGLYLTYGLLCGIGTGIVYVGIVGLMVRWFPEKRGFATGVVAAGYGFGAILTTFPINDMLASAGYQHTLMVFGIIFATVGVIAGLGMRLPTPSDNLPVPEVVSSARNYKPGEMVKTPVFWLMFVMMTMMSTGGLMVILNFANFARDFGVANLTVWGLQALPLALTVDRITNGLTRPFFGWVSDRIGRENTMGLAFLLEGAAITLFVLFRNDPMIFVILSAVVFFGWGEIFSLFPSTLTDTFGTKHATTNYGILYMAQGVGSVLGGPIAALLHDVTGSWMPVFGTIITMDVLTGLLALFILKPMRSNWLGQPTGSPMAVPAE
ncbi:MAG: oxalate/formate MFS antiporter [Xanthobacteraceae bacterium]|nr:oxalate/formate MFS antiporter [Xanthobacteraceae bacterium]